jgi:uroporphyrinogen III methyltransferase/synthase
MGVKSLPRIAATLIAGGMSSETPAASVQWGTYGRQQTVTATLSTLSEEIQRAGLEAPVITVIGPVVSLRETIAWFDRRPLFGKRILVTRAQAQAATLSELLAAQGADVIEMPATKIEQLDGPDVDLAISRLSEYQWLIFTSQNGVRVFWNALLRHGLDSRALRRSKVAAVGSATADALLDRGIVVDLSPERFVAEALLDVLRDRDDVRGSRVLYAAADGARDVLPQGLGELGAVVDRVNLYQSVPDGVGADGVRARLLDRGVDLVTFTSASAVRAFVSTVGEDAAKRVRAASIGPVTSEAVRAAGIDIAVESDVATMNGLVEAICDHYAVLTE